MNITKIFELIHLYDVNFYEKRQLLLNNHMKLYLNLIFHQNNTFFLIKKKRIVI